jgi:ubiquinone biosynthesis accessory factor UbiJ
MDAPYIMKPPALFFSALSVALNGYLRLDANTLQRLGALSGKVIAIELRGLDLTFYLLPHADGIRIEGELDAVAPDAWLSGAPLSLARLGVVKHEKGTLFSGDVEIRGDIELGQRFKAILDGIDIDWEEHVSRVTGDVIAHQAGNMARRALQWGRDTLDTVSRDVVEYLHEESRDLPTRSEVGEFLEKVDTLRLDVERLEARVQRLQSWLARGL